MKARHYNDTYQQALNYANADRSDPFAFARAMAHSRNGVCDSGHDGKDCRYKADVHRERRLLPDDGRPEHEREYFVDVYTNLQRP